MDLLSTIRKTGSRGGVNFSWDEVSTSAHRENYLGHSLKAPVGRWQKGRDLNWYAKGDGDDKGDETVEERKVRERKEEIRRVKEAEEDALNRALGLPVVDRSASGGNASGANNVGLGEVRRVVGEVGIENGEGRFGEFVGKVEDEDIRKDVIKAERNDEQEGGLLGGDKKRRRRDERDSERRHRRREDGEERRSRVERRSRSPGSHRRRRDYRDRSRSRSPYRGEKIKEERGRERSLDSRRRRDGRERSRERSRERRRRSRSVQRNEERRQRDRSPNGDRKRRGRTPDIERKHGRERSVERSGRRRGSYDRRRSP